MRYARILAVATLLTTLSGSAAAVTIEVLPSATNPSVGDPLEVAIAISDLGAGVAPSLGAFDLDLIFDAAVLSPTTVVFGDPVLGDQLDLFSFGSISGVATGAGVVDLFEISLDAPSDLDTLQADAFTLATVSFGVIGAGVSSLDLANVVLSDSLGLLLDADVVAGSVTVGAPGAVVPEPTAALVFVVGLAVVATGRRRRGGSA